ncbi:MAG TPA: hypothetical protein VIF43_00070 [Patescibacteria group bacterium]|jgi:hypothetical protein
MKRLAVILTWVFVLALQIALWPEITVRVLPAFAFATALAWGIMINPRTGFWLAGGSGLLLDLYAQHDLGMVTVASLAGYGVAWGIIRGYLSGTVSWGPVLLGAAVGSFVYELFLLLWMEVRVDGFPLLAETIGTGTLNALATFVVFLVAAGLASAASGWFNTPRPRHERSLRYR